MRSLLQRVLAFLAVLLVILAIGTSWYHWVEGWTVSDGLYMTVITLTTVGFQEVQPLTARGRLFTTFLILLGVGAVLYGFSTIGEYLLTSGVVEGLRKRGKMRVIERLTDHFIVCGAGRVGRTAARTMEDMGQQFVLVERDEEKVEALNQRGWTTLAGDATSDDVLISAGIRRARGLLVCTGHDSDNLFIVLSARALNPDLFIVSRSLDAANESKMRRAGADKVVSPYHIGGRHMANVAIRPHVAEFMEVVTLDSGLALWLEEITILDDSAIEGLTVVEADLRRRTGVTLVALLRGDEKVAVRPDEKTRLVAGDELIVLGTREQLAQMEELVGGIAGHPIENRRETSDG